MGVPSTWNSHWNVKWMEKATHSWPSFYSVHSVVLETRWDPYLWDIYGISCWYATNVWDWNTPLSSSYQVKKLVITFLRVNNLIQKRTWQSVLKVAWLTSLLYTIATIHCFGLSQLWSLTGRLLQQRTASIRVASITKSYGLCHSGYLSLPFLINLSVLVWLHLSIICTLPNGLHVFGQWVIHHF